MRTFVLAVAACVCVAGMAYAGEISLPAPVKVGGMPLFQAIDNRASATQASFPKGELTKQDLATILWAATGPNRDGKLWTVPMAMGKPPYCKVYYVDGSGSYRYRWQDHTLLQVSDEDNRSAVAMQNYAKNAPGLLVLAIDGEEMKKLNNNPFETEFGLILVGAMSQNIYLACEGLGVGARLVYSINRDEAGKLLGFTEGDRAVCAMVLGKR